VLSTSLAASLRHLWRGTCLACDLHPGEPFCRGCLRDFAPPRRPRCPQCGAAMHRAERCGGCIAAEPAFDATVVLGDYLPPLDAMVLALKSGARLDLAPPFGRLLARRAARLAGRAACVIPVPLSPERLRRRGFNQALELARPIARALQLPVAAALVARVRQGTPQQQSGRAQRRANLAGAFAVGGRLAARDVLLVDDVLTTGSTLDALATALKRAGAGRVTNLVVARTP